jgi:hypothetical protein
MNPKHHKQIITELAACEKQLDVVLFDLGDTVLGGGAAVGGLGLAGGGLYAAGRYKRLKKKGLGFLEAPVSGADEVARDIVRGGKAAKTGIYDFIKGLGKKAVKAVK